MREMNSTSRSTRRVFLLGVLALGAASMPALAATQAIAMRVWKDPNCGCCKDWIAHMEQSGFSASVADEGNNAARARLGVAQKFASCHTALVQGYVIEGHVPVADIQRLLKEKPKALGLAVPGMPIGSPGMESPDGRRQPFTVNLLGKDGTMQAYSRRP